MKDTQELIATIASILRRLDDYDRRITSLELEVDKIWTSINSLEEGVIERD